MKRKVATSIILIFQFGFFCCSLAMGQGVSCETENVKVFGTKMNCTLSADSLFSPDDYKGYLLLKAASMYCRKAIAEHDVKDPDIRLLDGFFYQNEELGTVSMSTSNLPPEGPLPVESKTHYLIYGEISGHPGDYTFTMKLETAVSREPVAVFKRSFASFSQISSSNNMGYNAGFQAFSPISYVIKFYETDKRKNQSDVAFSIDQVAVLPTSKFVEKNSEAMVHFQLTDCDGEPLANRTIRLNGGKAMGETMPAPSLGRFNENEVQTDNNGRAKATFQSGGQTGIAHLHVFTTYKIPCGEERYATGTAQIEVRGEPITSIHGEIEVSEVFLQAYNSFNDPDTRNHTEYNSTSALQMTIVPDRIRYLRDSILNFNQVLRQTDHFPIVYGKTLKDSRDEPTPIREQYKQEQFVRRDGKLELESESNSSSTSTGFDLSVSIETMGQKTTDGTLMDAARRRYCVVIKPVGNTRGLFDSRYGTKGEIKGRRRNDLGKMEPFSEQLNKKYSGGIMFDYTRELHSEDEIILPLEIRQIENIENYLLNPNGELTIEASGKYYLAPTPETQRAITVKLRLWNFDINSPTRTNAGN
jgi:hypothetical protein